MRTFFTLLVSLVASVTWAQPVKFLQASENLIQDQYIVVFQDTAAVADASPADEQITVSELAGEMADRYGAEIQYTYNYAIKGFAARMSEADARSLALDSRVRFVEQDGLVFAFDEQTNATWGLDRVDQRDLPLNKTYVYDQTGAGVNAYIIDTGIRITHRDFEGRAQSGFSSIDDGRGSDDCNGHGTHVAGTVGSATYGIAKGVTLHAVRVLSCSGRGSISGVVKGIDWVTANHIKPAVANMSLGGGPSSTLDIAVKNSIAAGVNYAIAAGNSDADACNTSPARVRDAITVAASTSADARASFSNKGSCVQVFAPGLNITSTWIGSDTATNTISGTSMASPHVAGVVALFLETNPDAGTGTVMDSVTRLGTQDRLSDVQGSPNTLLHSRIAGAVDQPPVAAFNVVCNGFTCSFDASASSDDRGIQSYFWEFGDSTTGTGVVTEHAYQPAGGTFQVTLTVTDTAQQTGQTAQDVSVPTTDNPPVAGFTFNCDRLICDFDASQSSDDVGITSYTWDFGDGATGGPFTVPTVRKVYISAGTFDVTLSVADTAGQVGQAVQSVVVSDPGDPRLIGENLSSDRGGRLPADRLQVVMFYDGTVNGETALGIEVAQPGGGQTSWIWINGLRHFGDVVETREYAMDGAVPTGVFEVKGAKRNGFVDGVAFGLFWKDTARRYHVLKSSDRTGSSAADFVCGWPLAMSDTVFQNRTPQVEDNFARGTAKMAICGAELLPNGFYTIDLN